MQPTKIRHLILGGLAGVVLGFGFYQIWEAYGNHLPGLPVGAIVGMVVLGLVLLLFGWPIRRWTTGDRSRPIDPIRAARVLVMAKAASFAGSWLVGWYVGAVLYLIFSVTIDTRRELGLQMVIAVLAAAFLVAMGLLVERFCQLPPDDTHHEENEGHRA